MNGSRQRYRLDDYLQDKAQRAASPLRRVDAGEYDATKKIPAIKPVHTVTPTTIKPTVARVSTGGVNPARKRDNEIIRTYDAGQKLGSSAAIIGGRIVTRSQLTTAYTQQILENAMQNLLAMQNRKFKYDERSSPLYTIVQKQAEENARLASGRAYAQAKGATGGYGSSYATLAADEAGRQAMRELDDQQLALYEAAKSEFEAENSSALDWYIQAKDMYNTALEKEKYEAEKEKYEAAETEKLRQEQEQEQEAQAAQEKLEQSASALGMNTDTYSLMVYAGQNGWYDGKDRDALRVMLNNYAVGNPNINVNEIMEKLAGPEPVKDENKPTEETMAASDYLTSVWNTDYKPDTMAAALRQKGYSEADINAALEAQRKLAAGTVVDYIPGSAAEAVEKSGKIESAYRQGILTEREYIDEKWKNSEYLKEYLEKEIKRGAANLDTASGYVVDGQLSAMHFQNILASTANKSIEEIVKSDIKYKNKLKDIFGTVNGVLAYVDEEVITETEAVEVMDEIAKSIDLDKLGGLKISKLSEAEKGAFMALYSALIRVGKIKTE